jgi:hypothetical protein
MHPYITQALMNERVADMHAAAAAARRAREAHRSRYAIPVVPSHACRGAGDRQVQAGLDRRSAASETLQAASAGRAAHRAATAVAVSTRPEAGDSGADSRALCGTGRGH